MEEQALQTIDIRRIQSLGHVVDEYVLGSSFILGEVSGKRVEKSDAILKMLNSPVRFDGYILFFLKKGHFALDVDLNTYDIHVNSLLVVAPGNIIRLSRYDEDHIGDAEMLFALVSKEMMSSIRFDFGKVFQDSIRIWNNPCITLQGEELDVAEEYLNLSRRLLSSEMRDKQEILGSLLTSFFYYAVDLWTRKLASARENEPSTSARVNQIFERFIDLVTEYHNQQRGVAFYADKLCLTPKYLSKLIKQSSGRSAPDWIDSFVILEAKNLLKYSDKPIKEIVYLLHFPNQSVFYKYFKAHTGQTPSEYRRS